MNNIIPKNILQEVVLSSNENTLKNGSTLEFSLPNFINCDGQDIKVGVKNIKFPEKILSLKVKLHAFHVLETVDFSRSPEFDLTFKDYIDLCQQLELIAFDSLGIESSGGLDFRNPKTGDCQNSKFILSIKFKHNRIVVRKNIDYTIFINETLEKHLKFGLTEKVESNGLTFFKLGKSMHLSGPCLFTKPIDNVLNLVVYNLIESSTYSAQGSRYPIICAFNIDNSKQKCNELLGVKSVSVSYVKNIKCMFLNELFQIKDLNDYDLINDPFMFTLIFFKI